ncbi:hypothetical protein K3495_g886 [Podosphaera aphanis]|nr:hypothetical protein K3495_g886 [Podosphaera aphanis]
MTTDDQTRLLNQISQLAGQINRHKNGQQQSNSLAPRNEGYTYSPSLWRPSFGGYPRGSSTRKPGQPYRNRSLVLTGAAKPASNPSVQANSNHEKDVLTNISPGWISKTDRHRQLINASVFHKTAEDRARAIEATRQMKLKQRQEREKSKLLTFIQRGGAGITSGTHVHASNGIGNYEVDVQGIRFLVAKNGSKLIKVSGNVNSAKSTPKVASIGPVKFYRSKNGNMYRSGIVKAHRATGVIKKVDELCRIFTTTGSCPKGPTCRYVHNPTKVAVCKEYLLKGSCPNGESCDLSHELTPERTPACLHFARGNCNNSSCRYTHVRVSPSALVCREFGRYGYCEKGLTCMERHVHECPDFSNTGTCSTRGCKLPHREKASIMRNKASNSNAQKVDDEISDVSSDEEEVSSDDVDSDDLEEFYGDDDGAMDTDIPMQQDFVQL